MRAHGVLALGIFFDQFQFLMDFSSLLTDEGLKRLDLGVRQVLVVAHKAAPER